MTHPAASVHSAAGGELAATERAKEGVLAYHGLSLDERRRLGVYYTPDAVARTLVDWAVRPRDSVLDPSFGGCSFLDAALTRLEDLGDESAPTKIFGIDVDGISARSAAATLLSRGVPLENIKICDFFSLAAPRTDAERYGAVVGNPPYVRGSRIDSDVAARAFAGAARAGVEISRRASLWAPFVALATLYVRRGGRLAFLLPTAVLEAEYASSVTAWLTRSFGNVALVSVRDRLFGEVEEQTVVLLAGDRGGNAASAFIGDAKDVTDAIALIDTPGTAPLRKRHVRPVKSRARDSLTAIWTMDEVVALTDVATIRIGVVTGANAFFVRPRSRMGAAPSIPIVRTSKWLSHARWTRKDEEQREREGAATRLLMLTKTDLSRSIKEEIEAAELEGLHERSHCRRRSPWWGLQDAKVPPVFLPYMGAWPPRLVINDADATCTNSVHRVYWRDLHDEPRGLVASSWTSLFAFAAELSGRRYGGGVLKLEPRAAARLPVIRGLPAELLEDLDEISRTEGRAAAVRHADEVILRRALNLDKSDVAALATAASELAAARLPRAVRRGSRQST